MSTQPFSPRSRSTRQLKKYYSFYTGGFIAFLIALAIAEQMGMSRQWIGYWFLFATIGLYAGIGIMSRTVGRRRVLRRGAARAGVLQRHGDRRRLDERGVVHRHGRHAVPRRLRRPGLRHGLDRRLLPGGAVPRALPAQVRPVHDSGLPRRALRRQHRAHHRHHLRDHLLVRLRRGADLRRRPDHQPLHRARVRHRRVRRPRRHPGVLDAGRHEGGDLDAGGAVHHPDHRLPDPGGLAGHQAHRHPGAADRLWLHAAEGRASSRRRSPPIRRSRKSARSSATAPRPPTRR